MDGPDSSYSCLEIHICWKVEREGQDGATDPYGVLSLWWGDDLDLHGCWGKGSDFLLHPVSDTWVHGGATRQYVVGVQVLPDVDVTLHDGVVAGLMDTSRLHTWEQKQNFEYGWKSSTSPTQFHTEFQA